MSDFKIFQLNKKAKFLNKAKDAKSKRTQENKNLATVVLIQKNIRAFIIFRRQEAQNNPLFIRRIQSSKNEILYKKILIQISFQPKIIQFRFISIFLNNLSTKNYLSQIQVQPLIQTISQNFPNRINSKDYCLLLQQCRMFFTQKIFIELIAKSSQFIKAIKNIIAKDILYLCEFLTQFKGIQLINQIIEFYYEQEKNLMQMQEPLGHIKQGQKQQKLLKSYYNSIYFLKQINSYDLNSTYIIKLLSSLVSEIKKYYINFLLNKYKIDRSMYDSKQLRQEILEIFHQKKQWSQYEDALYHLKDIISTILLKFVEKKQNTQEKEINKDIINILIQYNKINQAVILMDLNNSQFFNLIEKLSNRHQNNKESQQIKNYQMFIIIILLEKYLENINDLKFKQIFHYEKDHLGKVIKEYLIRFMKNWISFNGQGFIGEQIVKHFTSFMNNLYNKIFRTKLLSTKIFEDPAFIIFQNAYIGNHAYFAQMIKAVQRSPYLLPIETRFLIFRTKIRQWSSHEYYQHNNQKAIRIHRGNEFKDAFNQLYNSDIRRRFQVVFINQFGQEQLGMDAGGLTKQLLTRVFKQAFSPKFGRFIENNQKQLMPNPYYQNIEDGNIAKQYEFIGRLLGKCLFQNIMLGMKFAGPFLNLLINRKNTFDELLPIDPQLYKSLVFIMEMQEGIQQLELTFQYHDNLNKNTKNLLPNGNKIKVTKQNKMQYINLLVNYKVNKSFQRQTNYVRKGLKSVINQNLIKVFNYAEFNYLLSGQGKIDVFDWKKYSRYPGGQHQELLSWFWEIVFEYNEEQKSLLLKFVTSCQRPSFLGFKDLHPQFTVRVVGHQEDSLPVSHTCSNILDLPKYSSKQVMRQKLTYAIKSGSGFDMG